MCNEGQAEKVLRSSTRIRASSPEKGNRSALGRRGEEGKAGAWPVRARAGARVWVMVRQSAGSSIPHTSSSLTRAACSCCLATSLHSHQAIRFQRHTWGGGENHTRDRTKRGGGAGKAKETFEIFI